MQVAAYDRWEERTLWQFVDIGTFPLQPKYSSLEKTGNIKQDLDMPIVKIRAKGANDDDIERAIRGYLRWNATDKQFGLLFMKIMCCWNLSDLIQPNKRYEKDLNNTTEYFSFDGNWRRSCQSNKHWRMIL